MDSIVERLSLTVRDVTNQRIKEICAARQELLENRENVTMWVQDIPGKRVETRYIFDLLGVEIARFSVFSECDTKKFTVTANTPIFS